jgi:hypothetical protein
VAFVRQARLIAISFAVLFRYHGAHIWKTRSSVHDVFAKPAADRYSEFDGIMTQHTEEKLTPMYRLALTPFPTAKLSPKLPEAK